MVINRENFFAWKAPCRIQGHAISIKASRVLRVTSAETLPHDFH